MSNIIEQLKESSNAILKSTADSVSKWSKCLHNKQGLETILSWNICELVYESNENKQKTLICTSNTTLIEIFSKIKDKDRKKSAKNKNIGIYTKDSNSILTYDLIEGKYKTVLLTTKQHKPVFWLINNLITISNSNILVLDKILRDILGKKIVK